MHRTISWRALSGAALSGVLAATALGGDSVVEYIEVESEALKRSVKVGVYLPAGYDTETERRYPSLYFLHGLFGSERKWEQRGTPEIVDALIEKKEIEPLIVVCPDGQNSFWMKWVDGTQDWDAFLSKELVAAIDARFRTRPERGQRGLSGDSMGGLGALNVGLKHTEVFGSISAHSAAILPLDPAASPDRMKRMGKQLTPIFGNPIDLDHWKANHPLHLAETLDEAALKGVALYFDCGEDDRYGFDEGARSLHAVLEKRAIPHEWKVRPGNHGADYFLRYVDQSLAFHAKAFAAASEQAKTDSGAEKPKPKPRDV